jgi:hypothetical protein
MQRIEEKFLLDPAAYQRLMQALAPHLVPDAYPKSDIKNVYYDTPSFELIRHSIAKPVFKEKLRLRSYGEPCASNPAFIELKRKCKGVVYKRRVAMPVLEAEAFLAAAAEKNHELAASIAAGAAGAGAGANAAGAGAGANAAGAAMGQTEREIFYMASRYDVAPRVALNYRREAFAGAHDASLRITFDRDLAYQTAEPTLRATTWGAPAFVEPRIIMEIKCTQALPLWLARLLSTQAVFPRSFSKYGFVYKTWLAPLPQDVLGGMPEGARRAHTIPSCLTVPAMTKENLNHAAHVHH